MENKLYFSLMRKHEEYLNSPYKMNGLVERFYIPKEGEKITVDPETGQFYAMRKIDKDKAFFHDELSYTKLFQSGINMLLDLPTPALKMILYAISTVKPLSETVIIHGPDVCAACKIANGTFYNNLYELLDRKIISRKLGSSIEFWFDPNIFFNGNRVKVTRQTLSSFRKDLNLSDEVRNP